ncbi:MAG: hypothetical protein WDW36_005245 [Sanguina aurantia]
MGADDDEWQTVRSSRRRSNSTPATVTLLKRSLPIPVVPLAIRALTIEETEAEVSHREKEKAAKALKKKKRATSLKEQEVLSRSAKTDASSPKLSTADALHADTSQPLAVSSPKPVAQPMASQAAVSLSPASFLQHFMAFVEWLCSKLGIVLSKSPSKKLSHRARKAATAAAAAAAGQQQPPSLSSDPGKVPNASAGPSSTTTAAAGQNVAAAESKPRSVSNSAASGATGPVEGAPARQDITNPKAAPACSSAQPSSTTVATAAASVKSAISSRGNHAAPAATAAAENAKPHTTPAAQAAKAKPASMVSGSGWKDGQFLASHVPAAHADVLTGLTVAGELVLTAGYDGAVKVWSWPKGSTSAPRYLKSLVGHTGRVEAICSNWATKTAVTAGRDSMLKVWRLDASDGARGSKEAASHYVYESVKSMAVDWSAPGGGSAILGARSGSISFWQLETGRKLQVLKHAHSEEVGVLHLQGQLLFSGGRDEVVRVWDLRQGGQAVAALRGAKSRVCALTSTDHSLFVGDCSSSIKVFDLRALPVLDPASRVGTHRSGEDLDSSVPRLLPSSHIPNVPTFAGDVCPVAGLWHSAKQGVLVSSSIAWWTENTEALEEAPEGDGMLPLACLNVFSVGGGAAVSYAHTLRVAPGVVTCIGSDAEGARLAVGNATGGLSVLSLGQGQGKATAQDVGAGDDAAALVTALDVGVQEFSDDEGDDAEEGGEDDDEEAGELL